MSLAEHFFSCYWNEKSAGQAEFQLYHRAWGKMYRYRELKAIVSVLPKKLGNIGNLKAIVSVIPKYNFLFVNTSINHQFSSSGKGVNFKHVYSSLIVYSRFWCINKFQEFIIFSLSIHHSSFSWHPYILYLKSCLGCRVLKTWSCSLFFSPLSLPGLVSKVGLPGDWISKTSRSWCKYTES